MNLCTSSPSVLHSLRFQDFTTATRISPKSRVRKETPQLFKVTTCYYVSIRLQTHKFSALSFDLATTIENHRRPKTPRTVSTLLCLKIFWMCHTKKCRHLHIPITLVCQSRFGGLTARLETQACLARRKSFIRGFIPRSIRR